MAVSAKIDIENAGELADELALALVAALEAETSLPVATTLARIIGIDPEGNLARKLGNVYTTAEIDALLVLLVAATATAAQGAKADSAVQPGDLGTAALADASDFATAAQGTKAESALQSVVPGTNVTLDNSDPQNPILNATPGATDVAGATHAAPTKTTLVDSDEMPVVDSEASYSLKRISIGSFKLVINALIAAYVAAQDVEVFKGFIDCSANPNFPAADAGHVYRVSVAGKIGGASGVNVEVNDRLECILDGSASGTQAAVGANWMISQVNIDGAVTGPVSATDGAIVGFNGTSGKTIKALTAAEVRAAIGLATTDSPQLAAINLGHATDTTITRASPGKIAVEGVEVLLATNDIVIPAGITVANTGLHLLDLDASHDLILAPGSDLTADRTVTIITGDANKTLDLTKPPPMELLQVQSPSAASSVTFTSGFSSTYDHYIFIFEGLTTGNIGAYFRALVSSNGGSSYVTTGYATARNKMVGTTSLAGGTNSAEFQLSDGSGAANDPGNALNGTMDLILYDTSYASIQSLANMQQATHVTTGYVNASSRVNAIQFSASSGTVTGKIKMFGVQKS